MNPLMAKLQLLWQLMVTTVLVISFLTIINAVDAAPFNQSSESNEDYGFEYSSEQKMGTEDRIQHILKDNGMLQLVLHDLAVTLIKKLQANEDTQLHDRQVQIIKEDILDFYNQILDHPALNNDRVIFSQRKPNFRRMLPPSVMEAEDENVRRSKRSGHLKEVCNSVSKWKPLLSGQTRGQDTVTLLEDQYFYVTECTKSSETCEHISSSYSSKCLERSSWNIAYVWSTKLDRYVWDWIAVNTCCSCAAVIKRKDII